MLLSLSLFTLLPCCQQRCHRNRRDTAAAAIAVGWHGGWHYLIVWAIELSNQKNQEQKYNMALDGRQTQIKMQQSAKNMRAQWGRDAT
jgi:hypothetical protein